VLAESLQEIIEPILEKNETSQLRRVVERFQSREHLDGVGVYGPQGQLIAESSSLGASFQAPQISIQKARMTDRGFGELRILGGNSTHIYYQPLHHTIDANGKPLQHATDVIGVLTIYHDAGYIEAQTTQVWRETLWHVVIQVLLIVLITALGDFPAAYPHRAVDSRAAFWPRGAAKSAAHRGIVSAAFAGGSQAGAEPDRSARLGGGRSAAAGNRRIVMDRGASANQHADQAARPAALRSV
jgi:hypothetical protein